MNRPSREYWDGISAEYSRETRILCRDFHYGPLVAGDLTLGLLPGELSGRLCFEAGCGAGQNSVFLAERGARCTALDISGGQVRHGAALARDRGAAIHFVQGDLESLPLPDRPLFDLIHSAYALPFAADRGRVIAELAKRLRPGGTLLLSTAHPAACGEWIELDEGETGVFLTDYFSPPADRRTESRGEAVAAADPLSRVFGWLTAAGLRVDRFLEPAALPVRTMTPEEIRTRVPYASDAWLEHADELARVPFVAVFRALKP